MGERISGLARLAYSLGTPGHQLTDRVVVAVAFYYYLPPAGRGLVPQVSQEVFLGVLTVFGIAMLAGRVFDALADPLVGFASDRSRSRWGRRRSFLIYGIVPMVWVPALLFWPPGPPGAALNGIALAVVLSLYFVAFTVYVAPYLALLPELAQGDRERTRLATLLALVGFPVVGLYSAAWPAGIELGRTLGFSAETSLRGLVVISLGLAFVLCLLPILAVDEDRYTRTVRSKLPFREAVLSTLRNRPFRLYLAGQLLFVFAANVITPAPAYYATVVLGRSEAFAGALGLAVFASTVIGFPIVRRIAERIGAKRAVILCNLIFAAALGSLWGLEAGPSGGPQDARNLALAWACFATLGLAVAGFLVLPYVLIGQVIDYDARTTGEDRSAMYFGVQGFLTKWMFGLGSATVAFLLARFGKSPEEPLGVLLIGPVAALACFLSGVVYARYPEREVLSLVAPPEE